MSSRKLYKEKFYSSRDSQTKESALIVLRLLFSYVQPQSMVDFGCGVGTWVKTGQELGVSEILGLEGNWLDLKQLVIPEKNFQYQDLASKFDLGKQFDLAISLEVAEHIEEKFSNNFIDNLTQASEIILFSAAIPGQRGSGHVNEQWPDYWIEKFKSRGYIPLDVIRPNIWNEVKVKSWYKQNSILFIRKEKLLEIPKLNKLDEENKSNWSLVHPDTFKRQIEISHPKYSSLSQILTSLPSVTINSLKSIGKNIIRGLK